VAVAVPFVIYPKNPEDIPVDIASLPFTSVEIVTVPYAVAVFPAPDLSAQVVIVEPDEGAIPVPAGSCPSSHKVQPAIDVGLNSDEYGRAVIAAFDILTVSVCLKDA
jgi:hypothetical protein